MTPEELSRISDQEHAEHAAFDHTVNICMAAGCLSLHSEQLKTSLENELKAQGLEQTCRVRGVGCMGLCSAGPLVAVKPEQTMYQHVQPEDAPEIIHHLKENALPVERLALNLNTPFFTDQKKIVLENSGEIDPERIEEYIAVGGYQSLLHSLNELTPAQVIERITHSGLRGRGGAGYPTGLKWSTVAKAAGKPKYVICNADEGDPGAFMDRSVLESDPHRVIEGMIIAAYAVGAQEG